MRAAFRQFVGIASLLAAFVAWLELLWPVVEYYKAHPESRSIIIFGYLFNPFTEIYKVPGFSTLFLLLSLSLLLLIFSVIRAIFNYVARSRVDICVLEAEVDLRFNDVEMVEAVSHRVQTFHANRGGISAYQIQSTVDSDHGSFDLSTLTVKSSLNDEVITHGLLHRNSARKLDIVERFESDLPTSLRLTYLPNGINSRAP
jgi:hypothetical protein